MSVPSRLSLLLLAASFLRFGCHAQTPVPQGDAGKPLPAATAFRIEALLRRKADLPPASAINLSDLGPSDKMVGFHRISVSFTNEGRTSKAVEFLLSPDGKTLEQLSTFDIAANPRTLLPATDRPFRGGPADAPVLIVGFDDLECPFCAKLHSSIFPAITERYGNKVHFIYRDFPLEQHPWAMRASVDVNCVAAQSPAGYWAAVDRIHARAPEIGGDPKDAKAEKTMDRASQQLDAIAREEATKAKADMTKVNACIAKQDTAAIDASRQLAQSLNLQSTPTLFINGNKIDGAVPLDFLFHEIDTALLAEGVAPPPPYVAPAPPAAASTPAPGTTTTIQPTPAPAAAPKK